MARKSSLTVPQVRPDCLSEALREGQEATKICNTVLVACNDWPCVLPEATRLFGHKHGVKKEQCRNIREFCYIEWELLQSGQAYRILENGSLGPSRSKQLSSP
eukprot:2880520-Amphidinium_carterae.2